MTGNELRSDVRLVRCGNHSVQKLTLREFGERDIECEGTDDRRHSRAISTAGRDAGPL